MTILVLALWLIGVILIEDGSLIAYEWWRTVFIAAGVLVLIGLGRELVLAVLRRLTASRQFSFSPLLGGGVAGLLVAGVLHAAGVIGVVGGLLADAPPV